MDRTPEQWLDILAKRLDARLPYVTLMRRYRTGDAPLPEMGPKLRASWESFQRKSRANWGGFAVEARCDRLVYSGVTVGGSVDTDEAQAAARIVRNNRLEVAFAEAVDDCLTTGYGYLVVGTGEDGRAVVTAERPEQVIVAQDPLQSWRARAALKVWRDGDDGQDYAFVWADGQRVKFARPAMLHGLPVRTNMGGWVKSGEPESFTGPFPVFELEGEVGRSVTTTPWVGGLAILDGHTDLIDRINYGVLMRLVIMAMQAFRQRQLKMREGQSLPETDLSGNVIDYSTIFAPAPGALWELPPEVEAVLETQQTSAADLLLAVKDDLRSFGALTGALMPGVASDGENQSAEGARSGKEGTAAKASKFLRRARPVLSGAMVAALRVEGFAAEETVEVKFEPTDRVTLAEKMDAASKAVAAGMALQTVQRDILGWSEQQIAEDERLRRQAGAQALIAKLPASVAAPMEASPQSSASEMKAKFDALGVAIRSGVEPSNAAAVLGLHGIDFTGAVPVSLRLPEAEASALEKS